MNKLTEAEFGAIQDKLDEVVRSTKRGTPERAAVEARVAVWEAAIALPQATKAQRDARHSAIAEAAVEVLP